MMRAVVVDLPGGDEALRNTEIALPQPRAGEVRVRLESIGVNFADVMCRRGTHPGMRLPPIVPGCEGAGLVEALGPGVTRWCIGDRVAVYSPFGGTYAEAVVVPQDYALRLPDAMSFDDAAGFTHLALTAQEALVGRGTVAAGQTVLVTAAAGGLGGMLTQLAGALGLHVIAVVGSARKRQLLLDRGLPVVIDASTENLVAQVLAHTGGRGVDIAIETVGGALFALAQASLAPLGRIVIAGAASGVKPVPDVAGLLARSASCATLNLSVVFAQQPARMQQAWAGITALYTTGALRPRISNKLPLACAAAAHQALESRASVDKILLQPRAAAARLGTSFA